MRDFIRRAKERTEKPNFILRKDEITFIFGVLRIMIECFVAGRYPCYYPNVNVTLQIIFFSLRFIYYKSLGYHYFMVEFCYYTNLLLVLFTFFYPDYPALYYAVFGFSFGPLILAVVLFHNALVFHSIEKTTSNFLHLSPAFTMWTL